MDSVCVPAEFKHISKRRRMYNIEYRKSLRMNTAYITIGIVYIVIDIVYKMHIHRPGRRSRFVIPND
jgi:hypothetical protein